MKILNYIDGYKTYSVIVAAIINQIAPLLGLNIPPDITTTISVVCGVAAIIFNKSGRDKLKKMSLKEVQ